MDIGTATLGGRPLLRSAPVSWTYREGVFPNIERYHMIPSDALDVMKSGGPVELVITPPEGQPAKITNLWVLNVEPGPNPYISIVEVADRRWMWSYGHVGPRHYNMRRNVGVKRLFASDEFIQPSSLAPDVAYWPLTLIAGKTPYVALSMLSDVFQGVAKIEKNFRGQTFVLKVDDRIGKVKGLPIEEVVVDDAGDQAAARALSYLPEAGITIDDDGAAVVFSKIAGDEAKIVAALMPEMREMGHTDLVKNERIRPSEVHVLFTREVELRFDFTEDASARSTTAVETEGRYADNVAPVPDYQLLVSGNMQCQGTWLTMNELFNSWGNLPLEGITRQLDHDLVQRAGVPGMDLWEALGIFGDRNANQNTNWIGRFASVQEHYRRTFRLSRRWMDRIYSLRAYRIATVDPQTGQRAPARAYGDYSIIPSQKARWRSSLLAKDLDYAINKSAYPASGNLDSTAQPSPADVSILDHDQGIVHVDYKTDPNRNREMILPSQVKLEGMPTADITQRTRPISFNSVINQNQPPRLSPSFKLALILTAVPAVPNSEQQLHRLVVKPSDVADLLPPAARAGLNEAKGPVMEIRIGANVEVARTQWKDSESATIEQIFGLGPDIGSDPDAQAAFAKKVEKLTTNQGGSAKDSGASLSAIARAAAARVYASLVDRYEGSMTGYLNGNVHLAGWATELRHSLAPKGEATTHIEMPATIPQMSMMTFLDSNTRSIITKAVQPL